MSGTTSTPVAEISLSPTRDMSGRRVRVVIVAARLAIIGGFLAAWQWLPKVPDINDRVTFLDPFFISSPTLVAERIWALLTGEDGTPTVWSNLGFTLANTLIGTTIAVVLGTALGLALSNDPLHERILKPIIIVLNAVPRIAVVPVMILITGSAGRASIATAITVVIFLVFFNALEGGHGTPQEMADAARVAGARPRDVMLRVRLPYVLRWVAAALPNAIAFGLVGTVTTEIFIGAAGIGQLLTTAVNTADATLTFSVVVLLGATGAGMVLGIDRLRRWAMPW